MLSTAPCAVNAANWIQHTVIDVHADNGAGRNPERLAEVTSLFVERISRQDGERPWPEDVLE
jgi:hypothetical protein